MTYRYPAFSILFTSVHLCEQEHAAFDTLTYFRSVDLQRNCNLFPVPREGMSPGKLCSNCVVKNKRLGMTKLSKLW